MHTIPESAHKKTGSLCYFARMLDKIRLHAAGTLPAHYHAYLGVPISADGLCCAFLRVPYAELRERVLADGGTDEEILQWCFERSGRKPETVDVFLWNEFAQKLGWNDRVTAALKQWKEDSALAHRDDITTVFEYSDVTEGRKP